MGNKLSWEAAEKLGKLSNNNDSIYAHENKYGYKININHPKIKPIYEKYKKKYAIIIMSDTERLQLEQKLLEYLGGKKHDG